MVQGRSVMDNIGTAVGSAIERANEASDRQKAIRQTHVRRTLAASTETAEIDASDDDIYFEKQRSRSSLLLRMASLRRSGDASSLLNKEMVERYFPEWMEGNSLKSGAVLQDLIVAVAILAHESFDQAKQSQHTVM